MSKTISEPRPELKPHAPGLKCLQFRRNDRCLIGPGGKVIQEIQRVTGATIMVEEVDGRGDVNMFGENKEVITCCS